MGFDLINHPFGGTPMTMETPTWTFALCLAIGFLSSVEDLLQSFFEGLAFVLSKSQPAMGLLEIYPGFLDVLRFPR